MARTILGKFGKAVLPNRSYAALCQTYDRLRSTVFLLSVLGGSRQCPLCGIRLRRFRADDGEPSELFAQVRIVGGGPMDQAVCPWCGSFERERQVYLYLRDQTNILEESVAVMHLAPERRIQRWLRTHKKQNYLCVDLRSPLADIHADICNLPFEDGSFDVVICNHVLEHIPDDQLALRELHRVLKDSGWAMLQVPVAREVPCTEEGEELDPEERLRKFGQRDHVRVYGADYPERLEAAGFRVETFDARSTHGDDYVHRHGLIEDEVIYLARKGLDGHV